jgi:arabinofuranosyltransferase
VSSSESEGPCPDERKLRWGRELSEAQSDLSDLGRISALNSVMLTQQRRLTIATLTGISVVVLLALYGYWNIQQDDSYIFYSYAKNLANGHGYVFNVGERVNATTSPLYTLLLAVAQTILRFLPFVTIPLIGHLIGIASLFLICIFLMKAFKSESATLFPFVLPLVFLTNTLLPQAIGMETFLTMMLALMCLYLYVSGRLIAASLACSLAVLGRPDALLLAGVLVIYDIIRHRRLPSISMILVFLLPIAAWVTFSLIYFGHAIPSTLSAKLAQIEAGFWGDGPVFFQGLTYYLFRGGDKITLIILGAALLSGFVVFLARCRQWTIFRHPVFHLILLWNLIHLIVYGFILKAPAYYWYYTPLALGMSLVITLLAEELYRYFSSTEKATRIFLPTIYVLVILAGLYVPFILTQAPPSWTYRTYTQAAEWLNANAEDGSSVGANDIGMLRYFYERGPVIDAVGLVDPEIAEHVRQHDFDWYIHQHQPDYLMFNHPPRGVLEAMTKEDWFQKEYTLRNIIRSGRRGVGIYERQGPSERQPLSHAP